MKENNIFPHVEVNYEHKVAWLVEEKLIKTVDALMDFMDVKNKVVSILLCDNETIHSLNKTYRHKDYPTDVLSFEYVDDEEMLGDIAISMDKVKEQALEYAHTDDVEFKRLLIHGLLHLLGYDHEKSPAEQEIMEGMQDKLFDKIKDCPLM